MDNLTHTLFGLVLARTGLERTTARTTAALLVGANLPDIDLVTLAGGSLSYLKHHRGFTHSFLGMSVEALILTGILAFCPRPLPMTLGQLVRLYLMALIGLGSHFLLDYTNSYGVRPFLPFDGRWYAGDLVFIIDPWLLAILTLGMGIPFLFQIIYKEIGAKPAGYRSGAFISLGLVLLLWGSKFVSRHHAIAELRQRTYGSGKPVRVGALPQFVNPFGWYGVVETEKAYHLNSAGWSPFRSEFELRRARTLHKSRASEVIKAALNGHDAKIFMDFARYPLIQVNPTPQGYEVIARDLRFDFASRLRQGFLCTILLDENLRIISERFRY
jgi:inner membrane protein